MVYGKMSTTQTLYGLGNLNVRLKYKHIYQTSLQIIVLFFKMPLRSSN